MISIPDFNFHYHFSEDYTLIHTKTNKAVATDSYLRHRAIRRNDNKVVNADRHYLLATALKPYPHSDKAVVNWLTDKQDIFDLDSWEWNGYYTGFIPESERQDYLPSLSFPNLYVNPQGDVCNELYERYRQRTSSRGDVFISNDGRGTGRLVLVLPLVLEVYFGVSREAMLAIALGFKDGNSQNIATSNILLNVEFLTQEELTRFKPVPDNYPLVASKDGEICNVETRIKLKGVITKTYLIVSNKRTGKNVKVHRLVMAAWDYREDYRDLQVNHKNGNKLNNKLENLEWVTAHGNNKHARQLELQVSKFSVVVETESGYLRLLSIHQYARYLKQCPYKITRDLAKATPSGVYLVPNKDKRFNVNGKPVPLAGVPIKCFVDDVKVTDKETGKVSLFSCPFAAIVYFGVSKWKVTTNLYKQTQEVIGGKVFEWLKPE